MKHISDILEQVGYILMINIENLWKSQPDIISNLSQTMQNSM